jgi:tricorn protease
MKGAIETKVTPILSDAKLKYLDWTERNADFVDGKSGGRIGYMHLADMMGVGLGEFNEKLEKFRFKDALIIDVRFNGGGNIDERIVDVLERRPYQVTKVRGESALERPYQGFYGEIVVLINEFSFSDAEMFPAAMKARKLGTLIGKPTLGYVIAVTGHPMIDGGTVRKTFIGIWDISTGKMIEGHGTQPDILVENTPESEMAGRDLQLEKAIEFLGEKIAKNPRKFEFDIPNEKR